MYRLNLFISACLYFLVLVSCNSIPTHNSAFSVVEGGLLQTDSEIYEAEILQNGQQGVRFDIPYTITNTTGETIYMIGCRRPAAPVLQKKTDEEWVSAYSPVELDCLSPPFIVEPGEQRQDTLQVYGVFPGQNTYPEFLTDVEGVYRLEQRIYSDPQTFENSAEWNENLLNKDLRISNTFQVMWK